MSTADLPSPRVGAEPLEADRLGRTIAEASGALEDLQAADGHWLFELEADCTIPAEHIMLGHFLDEIAPEAQAKLATYIRRRQADHGGWPLFYRGDLDISCSVKAYFALKLAGDSPDAAHMVRARNAILAAGGAARSNVFTRIALALFGQVPWRAVPTMPVEIMLLPRWFPFHMSKISYWSRTVIAPLLILMTMKPRARNPRDVGVAELFTVPADRERHYFAERGAVAAAFLVLDKVLRRIEPWFPKAIRARAIARAVKFTAERLNGEDGLGGIFPAMASALMAFDTLGYPSDHPDRAVCRQAIDKLLVLGDEEGYCQPCLSPVWDTALAVHTAIEVGEDRVGPRAMKALDWLADRQILDGPADWRERRPDLPAGGWAFQYANPYYPDVDDTAVALMALDRAPFGRYRQAIERGIEWLIGVQSTNDGWGAFDVDNTYHYLNHIPFADHG
ncbi:MAG: squalene--hopene cyclase, partial [Alphaproteobacteria bacterium]|nr:squalene--hopene cyclase [Alphaproteobacteria bacterium]